MGVPVAVESESGKRIAWILKNSQQERTLGQSRFGLNDPDGLHRVRVSLSWIGSDADRRIVLHDILAANWSGKGFEENFPKLLREMAEEEETDEEEKADERADEPDEPAAEPEAACVKELSIALA